MLTNCILGEVLLALLTVHTFLGHSLCQPATFTEYRFIFVKLLLPHTSWGWCHSLPWCQVWRHHYVRSLWQPVPSIPGTNGWRRLPVCAGM